MGIAGAYCLALASGIRRAKAAQVNQDAGFQQFLGRHGQRASRGVAAAEQRRDAVRDGPDMQRDHQGRRPVLRWNFGAQPVGCGTQHGECVVTCFPQLRT